MFASLDSIIAENKPQSTGAPLPRILEPPHEACVVDVSDPAQVMEATRGMDAIINCTVTRRHPVTDFRVNMIGAYNVMRAAVRPRHTSRRPHRPCSSHPQLPGWLLVRVWRPGGTCRRVPAATFTA